jgi:hypothetical protein
MLKLILSLNFETPVCMEIFLLLAYLMKNPPKECALRKPSSQPFRHPPSRPRNIKYMIHTFFGDRFAGKEDGLGTYCTYNRPLKGTVAPD